MTSRRRALRRSDVSRLVGSSVQGSPSKRRQLPRLGPGDIQQRPNDLSPPSRDPRQARRSCASQDVAEDRLCLVVHRVPGEEPFPLLQFTVQRPVAGRPGLSLRRWAGRRTDLDHGEIDTELPGNRPGCPLQDRRGGPPVVNVHGPHSTPVPRGGPGTNGAVCSSTQRNDQPSGRQVFFNTIENVCAQVGQATRASHCSGCSISRSVGRCSGLCQAWFTASHPAAFSTPSTNRSPSSY